MQNEQPWWQVCIKCVTAVSEGDDNVKMSFFFFSIPNLFNFPIDQ